ncbi:NMT1/THI5 like-domain-containing protein [Dunaliella salina]|nr:NMT1/THI5 like-domain-containing protein [Dunaliella salina]|eukprot:KAF5842796.1 NMT1/THI5 like-domain-containing protein [Dunaliella salina]
MIKHDGGKGDYQELALPMLGIWNSLVKKEAEATWVFLGWEGVEAKRKGIALNTFKPEDYGVQYGYSPLLVAHPDSLSSKPDMVRAFLSATAQGFEFAAAHPEAAADQFLDAVNKVYASTPLPEPLDRDMVKEAQVWDDFLDWLSANGLLTTKVQSRAPSSDKSTSLDGLRQGDVGEVIPREAIFSNSLFTNDFLPKS